MRIFELIFGKKEKKIKKLKYDKKLINKFEKDHKNLVKRIGKINSCIKNKNYKKAKDNIIHLRMELMGHFMEEDVKLYWYLTKYYQEERDIYPVINRFKSSIKDIQKEVTQFLDYYSQKESSLDKTFEKEFGDIINKLAARIESEEKNLYTLYIK